MRPPLLLLLAALLAAACAGTPAAKDGATVPPRPKGKSPAPPKPAKNQPPTAPIIEPVAAFTGKVVLVNAPLKYVVIEGVIGRLPPAEVALNVYREGQKVGVLVVSTQARGANFAADLSQGEARVGDTVRSD